MTAVTQSSTGEAGAEGKQEVGEMDTACVSQAFVVSGKYFDWMTERHQTSSSWWHFVEGEKWFEPYLIIYIVWGRGYC